MTKLKNRRGGLVSRILALFLIEVFLAAAAEPAEPKRGGALRFGVRKNLETFNPFIRIQSINHRVRSLIYENLLAVDQDLNPIPGLARSWNISTDGLVYTFMLRPGVKFHNGKPLSPADIQWSIEYAQNPKNRAAGQPDLMIIDKIDAPKPDQLRIRLKSPFAAFLSSLAGIHMFPVVAKDSLQTGDNGRDALSAPGTGPFRFAEWKEGQELQLAKHDAYWQKGFPYLDAIRFIVVPTETVRTTAVRVGDLEAAEEIAGEQIMRIREGKVPGVRVVIAPAGTTRRVAINHCRPPFNNLKVRQALALALDKQEIIDGAYWGLGTPTSQRLYKGSKWFISELPERKQDLARARSLLAEAGYPNGLKANIDGTLGVETELQIIQSQAKKVGIELTIMMRDAASASAAGAKGERLLYLSAANVASDPDITYYSYYHTPSSEAVDFSGRTPPCYTNVHVDRLLEDARKTIDFQERRRMYKEIISIFNEELPDILIGFIQNGFAVQSSVQDFEPTIISTFSYGNGGLLKTWINK